MSKVHVHGSPSFLQNVQLTRSKYRPRGIRSVSSLPFPPTSALKIPCQTSCDMCASCSSQYGMWLHCGNVYHCTLGMCQKSSETTSSSSVASSNRPLISSVGTATLYSSEVMSQCLSEPVISNPGPILSRAVFQQRITGCKGKGAHRMGHRRILCLHLEDAQELGRPGVHLQDEFYGALKNTMIAALYSGSSVELTCSCFSTTS